MLYIKLIIQSMKTFKTSHKSIATVKSKLTRINKRKSRAISDNRNLIKLTSDGSKSFISNNMSIHDDSASALNYETKYSSNSKTGLPGLSNNSTISKYSKLNLTKKNITPSQK